MPRISFDSVSVAFGERIVLREFSCELTEHRIGIIGSNGSGKSTLIRLINGLVAPTTGQVHVDGVDVSRQSRQVRRRIGFVFSDADNQILMPTVREDVAFSLRRHRLSPREREAKIEAVLDSLGVAHLADSSPHFLSSGEKQLVALASILVLDPDIIIADEPTTLLDLGNRLRIKKVFDSLTQQLIVVSHDLDFLSDAHRVLWIDRGGIAADGPAQPTIAAYTRSFASQREEHRR